MHFRYDIFTVAMIARTLVLTALAASLASAGVVRRDLTEQALIIPVDGSPSTTTTTTLVEPITYNTVSPDGTCGGQTGYTCKGSVFGSCCSIGGYCGSTTAFCGTNCFEQAGLCSDLMTVVKTPVVLADASKAAAATTPKPTNTPWKRYPPNPPKFKPSYKIDNGERAPNQVWN